MQTYMQRRFKSILFSKNTRRVPKQNVHMCSSDLKFEFKLLARRGEEEDFAPKQNAKWTHMQPFVICMNCQFLLGSGPARKLRNRPLASQLAISDTWLWPSHILLKPQTMSLARGSWVAPCHLCKGAFAILASSQPSSSPPSLERGLS